MKLLELLEFDPRVARAVGTAAAGLGQAGQKLQEPLTVSDIQGRVEQGIDDLEKSIQANPQQNFAATFRNFLEKEKDKVKIICNISTFFFKDILLPNYLLFY